MRVAAVDFLDEDLGRRALNREIAAELGVSMSYASSLRNDPTGEIDRERKLTSYPDCPECDEKMYPGSRLCASCAAGPARPPTERTRPYRPWRRWDREACVAAVVRYRAEFGVLPNLTLMNDKKLRARDDPYPSGSTFYNYFPLVKWTEWQRMDMRERARQRVRQPGAVTGALCEAARRGLLDAGEILLETNAFRRMALMEAYGVERIMQDGGRLLGFDDFGKLWRLPLGPWVNPDGTHGPVTQVRSRPPLVLVEVLNSSPEPDGSFKDYWLRVHPELRPLLGLDAWGGVILGEPQEPSAHNAVASTFGLRGEDYWPEVQT